MSIKTFEDKSAAPPMPRELQALLALVQETKEACGLRAQARIAGLIPQLESAWSRVNRLQLSVSAQGGSIGDNMAILEACASALNQAQEIKARALVLTASMSTSYS